MAVQARGAAFDSLVAIVSVNGIVSQALEKVRLTYD